jgi:hypothetical protein
MGLIADTKQAIRDSPKGMFNWYVVMCTCIFAFAGVAKGFDEGKSSPCPVEEEVLCLDMEQETLPPSWSRATLSRSGLSKESDAQYANTKGWLVSIATAGAVFGCLGVCSIILVREIIVANF